MTESIISWYFDIEQSPCLYGFTVWQIYENPTYAQLVEIDSGTIELSEICDLIASHSHYGEIVLDKTPENITIKNRLYDQFKIWKVETIERTATLSEQITKYSVLFDKERFYLDDFKVCRDLIFDDIHLTNIVDPILTDEQTVFSISQALLVACHHCDSRIFFNCAWITDTYVSWSR